MLSDSMMKKQSKVFFQLLSINYNKPDDSSDFD